MESPVGSPTKSATPVSPKIATFGRNGIRGQTSAFPSTPTTSSSTPSAITLNEAPPGQTYAEFIRTWSDSHVSRWLAEIKCSNQAATFRANDIRGDILLELDQTILQEMGVTSIGDRLRIVSAVKILRQKASSSKRPSRQQEDTNTPRVMTRRLESARPAPLKLQQTSSRATGNLPHIVHDSPESGRLPSGRPPLVNGSYSNSSAGSATSSRHNNLPPMPPPPRSQPPLPPPHSSRRTPRSRTPTNGPDSSGLLAPGQQYGLPSDPRPGGGRAPQPTSRSTSPLPSANRTMSRSPVGGIVHGRSGSAALNSPVTAMATPAKRPSTANSHPYSNAQPVTLNLPVNRPVDLSPVAESTIQTPVPHRRHGAQPSLDDLRRKLVKFELPDENLRFTIDVDACAGGVEVIEKLLKKVVGVARPVEHDGPSDVRVEDGGLSVDGWAIYLQKAQDRPLTEAQIMSICHAPLDHPSRKDPLILRKLAKARSAASKAIRNTKRASAFSVLSGLSGFGGVANSEPPSAVTVKPPSPTTIEGSTTRTGRSFFGQRPPSELITNHLTEYFPNAEKKILKRTARQSMMRAGTPSLHKRDSTISFVPSIPSRFSSSTMGTRGSMDSGRRNSIASMATTGPPPSLPPKYDDTLSVMSHEDLPRVSLSTEDGHSVSLQDVPDDDEEHVTTSTEPDIPPQLLPPIPFPTESLSESLENLTSPMRSRPVSVASGMSRRMSFMTELRSKKDKGGGDNASLLTVDEITAEVESRRDSKLTTPIASDSEEWTKVDGVATPQEATEPEGPFSDEEEDEDDDEEYEEEDDEEEEEEDTLFEDDEDEGGGERIISRVGNKWIKGALIGAGSFGKVYLGMDASTGLLMAVKQVELPTGSAPNLERKQSMLSALETEIELLQNLQHENIVQYLYSSLEDACLNIFLEYVPGGSVTALLRNYGAFEETLVRTFVRQILQGLGYLHGRDIIHRDIKGANILVDNKGGVKISDFGISKKVDVHFLTGNNRVHRPSLQGSVFWMAPEVVKQSGHTQKADIWSVGCLVVEMFTGEHPWAQLSQMQAIFKIGSSAKPTIPSDISAEAQDFLEKTFEVDHEARPSAAELLQHPWLKV